MDYELPTEFDLIVVGTGVVESVISAAASRIGKRVLHIDSNNYYGALWASFNLDSILKLDVKQKVQSGEQGLIIGNNFFDLQNFQTEWHIPEKEEVVVETVSKDDGIAKKKDQWTQERLLKESRKFNIDLTPKLQFARGDFVELLISSNIARYSEYRSVSRVLTWLSGQIEIVPCSRSDVFANNKVSVIEKRMLMKLFTSLDEEEKESTAYEHKTFKTFLKEKKLTPNLIHYVLYSIAMCTDDTLCIEGIQRTKRFLNSLGRYGKTPFLFSMYGSGEITQGFCRLSAVFGGIYALSQSLSSIILEDNQFKGVVCGKQQITAEKCVLGAEKAPKEFIEEPPKTFISRAVLITDKSIMDSEKEHLTLLLYPPENGKNSITLIEMATLTGTCPKNIYISHLISRQLSKPQDDFECCINNLFNTSAQEDSRPKILWSCYFSIPDSNDLDFSAKAPESIRICPGPDIDLDYDLSIKKAKDIFLEMYPEAEFLPRAPDPEEIIIEGEDEGDKTEVVLTSESGNVEETSAGIGDIKSF